MHAHKSNTEILASLGITAWNTMQETAHDAILNNKDVLLLAPTGSGKTLAYLLPVLRGLKPEIAGVQCLVLVPSRELAMQIEQVWKKMSTGYKVNSAYGGHLLQTELQNLSQPPALLIGTPGRIADHITHHVFETEHITTLVLDEFDKSLALGFEEEMSFITGSLKKVKKHVLVSATAAIEIPAFAGVSQPATLDFIAGQQSLPGLDYKIVVSESKDKLDTLVQLLCYLGGTATLVFCNHREAAGRIHDGLADAGIESAYFHGGLEQIDREQTLARFRNGSVQFLIATDLAARGLDIPEVKNVVHYHLPHTGDEFIHRNGRTARMHATGTVYMLLHKEEDVPEYVAGQPEIINLPENNTPPPPPQWATIYVSGGKKDKINKMDIAGFFLKVGKLQKEELGLIDVKDFMSFAAVKKDKVKQLLQNVREEKMKGKKLKIAVAK